MPREQEVEPGLERRPRAGLVVLLCGVLLPRPFFLVRKVFVSGSRSTFNHYEKIVMNFSMIGEINLGTPSEGKHRSHVQNFGGLFFNCLKKKNLVNGDKK